MLRIITDSASDLPKDYIKQHDLHVIPTPVVIDDVDYLDGKTIQTEEFYHILDDIRRDVKTYHINPAMFTDAFLPYAQAGDSIIYLCFSTGIAGTYNAANLALTGIREDYPDFDIRFRTATASSYWISSLSVRSRYSVAPALMVTRDMVMISARTRDRNFFIEHSSF